MLFDPNDLAGMCEFMDKYGDKQMPFSGIDENGNYILIGVNHDNITVKTFQKNGWVRINIYYRDGTSEELFDK